MFCVSCESSFESDDKGDPVEVTPVSVTGVPRQNDTPTAAQSTPSLHHPLGLILFRYQASCGSLCSTDASERGCGRQ